MRILPVESLRFPGEGKSAQGKPVPKVRPKGVADGESVNIPTPLIGCLSYGGTQKAEPSRDQKCAFKPVGGPPGKSGGRIT